MKNILIAVLVAGSLFAETKKDPVPVVKESQEFLYYKLAYKIHKAQNTMSSAESAYKKSKADFDAANQELSKLVEELEKAGCKAAEINEKLSCLVEEKK